MPTKGECWLCHKRAYLTKQLTFDDRDNDRILIVMVCSDCADKLKKEDETHAH